MKKIFKHNARIDLEDHLITTRKSVYFLATVFLLTAFCLALSPIAANSQVCGDVNGDSYSSNVLDLQYLCRYFYMGGPQPVDLWTAEFDHYQNLTPLDFYALNRRICCGAPPPTCSTLFPPYQLEQDSALKISHTKWIEGDLSEAVLTLELYAEYFLNTVILPLEIRVGDDLPQIDSIDLESFGPINVSGSLIDSADSRVLLFMVYGIGAEPESTTLTARVFITVDSSTIRRPVSMNWSNFAPAQSSPPDSSLVPMVIYFGGFEFVTNAEPVMICCMGTHGDFNEDGYDGNILDLTHLVDYIFRGSGDIGSCPEETDVNEDGASANIIDLTTLVDYIFRGGAALPSCYF